MREYTRYGSAQKDVKYSGGALVADREMWVSDMLKGQIVRYADTHHAGIVRDSHFDQFPGSRKLFCHMLGVLRLALPHMNLHILYSDKIAETAGHIEVLSNMADFFFPFTRRY